MKTLSEYTVYLYAVVISYDKGKDCCRVLLKTLSDTHAMQMRPVQETWPLVEYM